MELRFPQEGNDVLRGWTFRRTLYASVTLAVALGVPSQGLPQELTGPGGLGSPSAAAGVLTGSAPSTPQQGAASQTSSTAPSSRANSPSNALDLTAPAAPQAPPVVVAPTIIPPNSGTLSALPYYARRALAPVQTLSRPFTFGGSIELDETVTDNVNETANGAEADLISTAALNLFVTEQSRLTQFAASGTVDFEDFARTSSLNGVGVGASGNGSVTLVNSFLTVDGDGSVSDQFINQFAAPATDRATAAVRARQSAFEVGPHLTTSLGDLIDLEGRARYAQVDVQPLAGTTLPAGLSGNSEIEQYLGRIATSASIRPYQMTITGEYLKEDRGFRLYNGLYSLYLGQNDGFQVVGRAGYESTTDPGITDISGLIWSAGFIARPGRGGYVRVEYGSRFSKPTWNASVQVALTPVLQLSGSYLRTLETEQARIARSLTDLTDFSTDQPIGAPSAPTFVDLNLISATFLSDDANATLSWQPTRSVEVTLLAGESHRRIFDTNTDERFFVSGATMTYRMTRRIVVGLDAAADKTLQSATGGFKSWDYRVSAQVSYSITKDVDVTAAYARQESFDAPGSSTPENAIEVTISKAF